MIYQLLSLLLQYPDERLLALRDEIALAVHDLPASRQRRSIQAFLSYWLSTPDVALQENYVRTFDFSKRSSLYLGFHIHGDRRQRGMGLVRLKRLYAAAGLPLAERELPDYLPVMLEFAALVPDEVGEAVFRGYRAALEIARQSLSDDNSPYAHLLDAVCAGLPPLTRQEREQARTLATEGPPTEQVGLEPFAPPDIMPLASGAER